jgi:hypothetical protein
MELDGSFMEIWDYGLSSFLGSLFLITLPTAFMSVDEIIYFLNP